MVLAEPDHGGHQLGELPTVTKLSGLGLNPDLAINCHHIASQAGRFINVCAIPWMDVNWASHLPAFVGGR